VREGEHVFAWFAIYSDQRSFEERRGAVRRELEGLAEWASGEPAVARLVPTARSLLRG
jgi:hypothetical protein